MTMVQGCHKKTQIVCWEISNPINQSAYHLLPVFLQGPIVRPALWTGTPKPKANTSTRGVTGAKINSDNQMNCLGFWSQFFCALFPCLAGLLAAGPVWCKSLEDGLQFADGISSECLTFSVSSFVVPSGDVRTRLETAFTATVLTSAGYRCVIGNLTIFRCAVDGFVQGERMPRPGTANAEHYHKRNRNKFLYNVPLRRSGGAFRFSIGLAEMSHRGRETGRIEFNFDLPNPKPRVEGRKLENKLLFSFSPLSFFGMRQVLESLMDLNATIQQHFSATLAMSCMAPAAVCSSKVLGVRTTTGWRLASWPRCCGRNPSETVAVNGNKPKICTQGSHTKLGGQYNVAGQLQW